jgi:hypothetical protein
LVMIASTVVNSFHVDGNSLVSTTKPAIIDCIESIVASPFSDFDRQS